MAETKESWYGEATFRKLMLLISQLWMVVTIAAQVMVLTVWIMIFTQNIEVFEDVNDKYMGNDGQRYDELDGQIGSSYVASTNMPKQLGGPVFASMFAVAMWMFILISTAADFSWRYPSAKRFLSMWHAPGLWSDKALDEHDYYYLWANCFLKLFIGVTTGSTSWRGLLPNNTEVDTEVFALYATMIYLVNIIFSWASQVMCTNAIKRGEWPEIFADRKAHIEASAGPAAVDAYKAAQKAEKAEKAKAAKAKQNSERPAKGG